MKILAFAYRFFFINALLALGVVVLLVAGRGCFVPGCPSVHTEAKTLGPCLREIAFTDYDIRFSNALFDLARRFCDEPGEPKASAPGCSVAVSGRFVGRNYDWMFSSADEYVIRVPARPGRHASLGVTTGGLVNPQQVGGLPLTDSQMMDLLPYCTLDGVNDAGLFVCDNAVPSGDRGHTTGTNPGGRRVNQLAFVRVLLDSCATVKEAIALAREVDLFSIPVLELHYLVADATGESCVIEIVDNRVVVLENVRAMTNFYLDDFMRDGTCTPNSMGIERHRTLERGLADVGSAADMVRLLSEVRFSLYVKPGSERDWWSELNGSENPFCAECPQSPAKFHFGDEEKFAGAAAARMKLFARERASLEEALDVWRKTGRIEPGIEAWVSIHSSVYDLKAGTLELRVLERDDKPYRFALSR